MNKIAILAAMLAVLAGAGARAEPGAADQLAGDLMVKSGLHEQIRQFPLVVRSAFQAPTEAPAGGELPLAVRRLNWIIGDAFDPQRLGGGVRAKLAAGLTRPEIETVLGWLDSPLGRRVTALEEGASTPKAYAAIAAMGEQGAAGVSSNRLDLLDRLGAAIRAEDHFTDMAVNSEIAIAAGAMAASGEGTLTFDQIVDRVEADRPKVKARMKQEVRNSFVYSYRTLSDDELAQYVAFAESETGRKYHRIAFDALNEVLLDASRRAGDTIEWSFEEEQGE